MNAINHPITAAQEVANGGGASEAKKHCLPRLYKQFAGFTPDTFNDLIDIIEPQEQGQNASEQRATKIDRVKAVVRAVVENSANLMSEECLDRCTLDLRFKLDFVSRENHSGACGIKDLAGLGWSFAYNTMAPQCRTSEHAQNVAYAHIDIDMTKPMSSICSCISSILSYMIADAELRTMLLEKPQSSEVAQHQDLQKAAKKKLVDILKPFA